MSDFYQSGVITTLHQLGKSSLERLESELQGFARTRPIALVLPALYSEFEGPAMPGIVRELAKVKYLNEVVLVLDQASEQEFARVREFMSPVGGEVRIIHNKGKRISEIYETLKRNGLDPGPQGKGRSAWLAYGYVLARAKSDVIALHDCDIVTYSRELLARLCYPVAHPSLDYVFCKGYYSRVSNKMNGRVTRLLVTPLVRSLQQLVGQHGFLMFLDSFRYPLSGEFCMTTDVARTNRIPSDWGLEVGSLAEVYRNYSSRRVCQVDIAATYDHKHQALSADDANKGLMKMTVDICKSMFRTLASEGVVFSDGLFKSLIVTYLRQAEDTLVKYEADATINGLEFDRHEEARAVEAFTHAVALAAQAYMENPMGTPPIPNWNRVKAAIPDIFEMLITAVEADNK
ncbi:MAG: glycosyl transferase [Gallionellales bacterium RIFCSPLOWO2_12_FULL_59_22]|nr:MAG: glycosyl transferase [Gallionellales bacterium RIFCSPLOWO2_02_FULL_59_110]OGT04484.1 MAG: glycosyl transferase [Gallionellales bacterium RIFCSPLOWO2_02_58_13]OGT14258.1 MAG: glycosyl transferase [Gallionellales bacterium RIFCSPLOWO2_12_FULL_59_22]